MAILGIVACDTENSSNLEQSLLLSADKSEITANGTDIVTFTVWNNNNEVIEATIYSADTNEALTGNTFKTKYKGEYKFYAKSGNAISNEVIVVAKEAGVTPEPEPEPEPEPDTLFLSVDKKSIDADGVQVATFTTTINDSPVKATIYNAANNTALSGNSFSTTEVGIYTFYAKYEELTSNEVQVTAKMVFVEEEKPIRLEASTTSIKANGVESVTLTVIQDGGNVTKSSTIYVNGGALNGDKFKTTSPGTYTIYAVKGSQTSNEIIVTAEAVQGGSTIVFAEGVTLTSGWYDVNKKSTPSNAKADAMMCWAASASNIIQWFQDRYVAAGNTLPAGCPNGTSSTYDYELQIMDVFRDNWDNLVRGGWADSGVVWYFEGKDINTSMGTVNRAYPKSGTGGYFNSVWSSISANMYKWENSSYANQINNYSWRMNTDDPLLEFSRYIVNIFKYGISSMAVAMSSNFGGGHAVTIWGYEIDNATDYITKLYITDSDDGSTSILREYEVKPESGNSKIVLKGYTNYYPFELYPIAGYNSANR